jgi:retron-type reverse transcriptase
VISPLLANLFLHYAFDMWMAREFPYIPFERYADDAICHCQTEGETRALWQALASRMADCKLTLNPCSPRPYVLTRPRPESAVSPTGGAFKI